MNIWTNREKIFWSVLIWLTITHHNQDHCCRTAFREPLGNLWPLSRYWFQSHTDLLCSYANRSQPLYDLLLNMLRMHKDTHIYTIAGVYIVIHYRMYTSRAPMLSKSLNSLNLPLLASSTSDRGKKREKVLVMIANCLVSMKTKLYFFASRAKLPSNKRVERIAWRKLVLHEHLQMQLVCDLASFPPSRLETARRGLIHI